jgi:hypothetical protein
MSLTRCPISSAISKRPHYFKKPVEIVSSEVVKGDKDGPELISFTVKGTFQMSGIDQPAAAAKGGKKPAPASEGPVADLSLSKLPWKAQLAVFAVLSVAGAGAYFYFLDMPRRPALVARASELDKLRTKIDKGLATARQLPSSAATSLICRTSSRPAADPAGRKGRRRSSAPRAHAGGRIEPDDPRLQATGDHHARAPRRVADQPRARRHVPQPRAVSRSRQQVPANHQREWSGHFRPD